MIALLLISLGAEAGVVEECADIAGMRSLRQATSPPAIPASAYTRAEAGHRVSGVQFVEGVAAGKGWGLSVMNAPVEAVWMALNSEETFPKRMGSLSASKIIGGTPRYNDRRLFQLMPLPIVSDRWWVVDTYHNEALYTASGGKVWEQSWTDATDPANLAGQSVGRAIPVAWTEGAWLLLSLSDGRTLAEYYAWSDPGGRLPAGPASRFATGAIKTLLYDIETYAKELAPTSRSGFVRPDQTPL